MRNVITLSLIALIFAIGACATPGSGTMSPGTAGGPAIASQGAQTIGGDQGQTPQTGTSGTATQNWFFAAQGDGEIHQRILEIAKENGWSAEQIANALAATNGAPETVTIQTGDQAISTGPASPTGATTGGGAGSAGGAGNTTSRP